MEVIHPLRAASREGRTWIAATISSASLPLCIDLRRVGADQQGETMDPWQVERRVATVVRGSGVPDVAAG